MFRCKTRNNRERSELHSQSCQVQRTLGGCAAMPAGQVTGMNSVPGILGGGRPQVTVRMKQPQFGPLEATSNQRPALGMRKPLGKKYSESLFHAIRLLRNCNVSLGTPSLRPLTTRAGITLAKCSGVHQILRMRPGAPSFALISSFRRYAPPSWPPMTNSPDRTGPAARPSTHRRSAVPSTARRKFEPGSSGGAVRVYLAPRDSAAVTRAASAGPGGVAGVCPPAGVARRAGRIASAYRNGEAVRRRIISPRGTRVGSGMLARNALRGRAAELMIRSPRGEDNRGPAGERRRPRSASRCSVWCDGECGRMRNGPVSSDYLLLRSGRPSLRPRWRRGATCPPSAS
jgi:hypothetical protein